MRKIKGGTFPFWEIAQAEEAKQLGTPWVLQAICQGPERVSGLQADNSVNDNLNYLNTLISKIEKLVARSSLVILDVELRSTF